MDFDAHCRPQEVSARRHPKLGSCQALAKPEATKTVEVLIYLNPEVRYANSYIYPCLYMKIDTYTMNICICISVIFSCYSMYSITCVYMYIQNLQTITSPRSFAQAASGDMNGGVPAISVPRPSALSLSSGSSKYKGCLYKQGLRYIHILHLRINLEIYAQSIYHIHKMYVYKEKYKIILVVGAGGGGCCLSSIPEVHYLLCTTSYILYVIYYISHIYIYIYI